MKRVVFLRLRNRVINRFKGQKGIRKPHSKKASLISGKRIMGHGKTLIIAKNKLIVVQKPQLGFIGKPISHRVS